MCLPLPGCGASLANPRQLPIYEPRSARSLDGAWLELHVKQDGRIWYGDRVMFDRKTESPDFLAQALIALREAAVDARHIELPVSPRSDLARDVYAPVLIRAHRRSEWACTKFLLDVCGAARVGFQTVRLATLAD